MLPSHRLARINELANKAKIEPLTSAEKREQQELRAEYLQAFRSRFKTQLHSITVVDEEGHDVTPEKLKKSKARHKKN
ncbi:uncharacterized protein YnzC (UPF0291/DUF896 family) [Pullulanibacillus pueri]|uniref:UPF0291 protein GCM10007096_18220 n=1 Tax=Pullulanibacillus pueri TaxID=1437324 RepID=A0A8J2ZVQ7_9BACL|nr:DUF896 domain-containing protein [Pullulanibacillus pueri]MBM7682274.1 uncharacterized protein YnzC (UPF0291/DUF896 family) [Pullulanibacillus pueri]GGH80990.1 UPF0291 protein [Pullulanibacillus pueri]